MEISNDQDTIDGTDVIEREEELGDQDERDEDEEVELASLRLLIDLVGGTTVMRDATLIRDSHFKEWAKDMAEETTDVDPNRWPMTCIDWDRAVEELQSDFSSVKFGDVTYWVRQ